ncbi:MAG TPA: tryptophan--tRNA ligase [Clostridia bacterium]|nr:tryptophan--tRNA ligase [Clostridia bacterium]
MEKTQTVEKQQRVFSAIQPTSMPTVGNYLGALKNWASMAEDYDCLFAVADLHAITVRQEPALLRKQSTEMLALLLALDLNPEKNIVFVQSNVPAHSELAWILNCYTQFGEASRMTQFKEKSRTHADNINVGLFSYPTLMAADILLYQTDFVPIGADQKQHLEITRDIAERFNGLHSNTFKLPEPFFGKSGTRVMSLQEPSKKMSKSDTNPKASVSILDKPDTIIKKFKSAVTDSEAIVRYSEEKQGINNLMSIYSGCTGKSFDEIEREFDGKGYGDFKLAVAQSVIDELRPVQEKYNEIINDKAYLKESALKGAQKAQYVSQRTLDKVKKKIGLLQYK